MWLCSIILSLKWGDVREHVNLKIYKDSLFELTDEKVRSLVV